MSMSPPIPLPNSTVLPTSEKTETTHLQCCVRSRPSPAFGSTAATSLCPEECVRVAEEVLPFSLARGQTEKAREKEHVRGQAGK